MKDTDALGNLIYNQRKISSDGIATRGKTDWRERNFLFVKKRKWQKLVRNEVNPNFLSPICRLCEYQSKGFYLIKRRNWREDGYLRMAEGDWNSKARGIRVFDFSWGSTGKESRGGGNEYGTTWWIGSRTPELKETTPLVHWEFESPKIKRSVPKRASASDRIVKRPNVKMKSLLNKKVRSRLVTPLNSRFPGIYIYTRRQRDGEYPYLVSTPCISEYLRMSKFLWIRSGMVFLCPHLLITTFLKNKKNKIVPHRVIISYALFNKQQWDYNHTSYHTALKKQKKKF